MALLQRWTVTLHCLLGWFRGPVLCALFPGSSWQRQPPFPILLDTMLEERALGGLVSCISYSYALVRSQTWSSASPQLTTRWPEQVTWLLLTIWLARKCSPTIWPDGKEQNDLANNSHERSALLANQIFGSLSFPQTRYTHLFLREPGWKVPARQVSYSSVDQAWMCFPLAWRSVSEKMVCTPSPRHTHTHPVYVGITDTWSPQ